MSSIVTTDTILFVFRFTTKTTLDNATISGGSIHIFSDTTSKDINI